MTTYAVICIDKSDGSALRDETRAAHIEYLSTKLDRIKFAGPLNSEDGARGVGSLYVLEVEDRAAAERFLFEEPYYRAELFETTHIMRWRMAIPESKPGQLRGEIEQARAAIRN